MPAQDLYGGLAAILPVPVCPVISGVEDLNESRVLGLDFFQACGLFKLGIDQAELDCKLGFNQILLRLPFFDITDLDFQGWQEVFLVCIGSED